MLLVDDRCIVKSMKMVGWNQIFKKYAGKWVVLAEDESSVVTSSEKAKTAFNKAKNQGIKTPILMKVPRESLPYVGQSSI